MKQIRPFHIIGISVRTTNVNGQAAKDLGQLWERFYKENIPHLIPNAISSSIFSIYTDYESNYQGYYTSFLGLQVSSLDNIPKGLTGRTFQGGRYQKFTAKGVMPQAVVQEWQKIWKQEDTLNRAYTADFEVYDDNAQKGDDSEVDIYIATK